MAGEFVVHCIYFAVGPGVCPPAANPNTGRHTALLELNLLTSHVCLRLKLLNSVISGNDNIHVNSEQYGNVSGSTGAASQPQRHAMLEASQLSLQQRSITAYAVYTK